MPADTGVAAVARQHRLDGDPITNIDAPAPGGLVADCLDDPERFVPRNHRHRSLQDPFVLFVIAAANAASFDAEDGAVVGDLRDRQIAGFEFARRRLHHRHRFFRQHSRLLASCRHRQRVDNTYIFFKPCTCYRDSRIRCEALDFHFRKILRRTK